MSGKWHFSQSQLASLYLLMMLMMAVKEEALQLNEETIKWDALIR